MSRLDVSLKYILQKKCQLIVSPAFFPFQEITLVDVGESGRGSGPRESL